LDLSDILEYFIRSHYSTSVFYQICKLFLTRRLADSSQNGQNFLWGMGSNNFHRA